MNNSNVSNKELKQMIEAGLWGQLSTHSSYPESIQVRIMHTVPTDQVGLFIGKCQSQKAQKRFKGRVATFSKNEQIRMNNRFGKYLQPETA